MNIRDYSSQFTVYVCSSDVDKGASAKVCLSQAGYDAYFFQDADGLEQRLNDNPPHVLVFSTSCLEGNLNDFVTHVLEINDDIKFVAMANLEQFGVLAQYNDHGFGDVISDEKTNLDLRVTWAVDRVCERLYLTYQNEQMFDELKAMQVKVEEVQSAADLNLKKAQEADVLVQEKSESSFAHNLAVYRSAESKEDIVQKFLNNISDTLCIYFKYLGSVRSFVATHANGIPSDDIQGVGCQLESGDVKDLGAGLVLGRLPTRFDQMLDEAFQLKPPKILPLYANGAFEGVFVYSEKLSEAGQLRLSEEFSLMSLCYSHLALEKKVDSLEVQDFVTELFNRNHYTRVLSDEIERARRLRQPISVVKIAMDDFYEIESSLGEAVRDELLKSLGTVVHKTSRSNDVTCRTGMNEIAMVLPHCSKKGAALRAERLRRIVEGSSFLNSGMKISVSLGISEYPSLCESMKSLDETASKALSHIIDKGGNKICLFKAPDAHRPEFEVAAE